jgi:hypothetical protein
VAFVRFVVNFIDFVFCSWTYRRTKSPSDLQSAVRGCLTCIYILFILVLSEEAYVTYKNNYFYVGKQPSVTNSG